MNGDKNKKTYFVLRITLCNFVYHKQKNADMNTVNPLAAIKSGWQCTKNNFIVSLGLVMAYWVFSGLLSLIPLNGVMGTIASLISMFVSLMWSLGIVRLTIDVVDGPIAPVPEAAMDWHAHIKAGDTPSAIAAFS